MEQRKESVCFSRCLFYRKGVWVGIWGISPLRPLVCACHLTLTNSIAICPATSPCSLVLTPLHIGNSWGHVAVLLKLRFWCNQSLDVVVTIFTAGFFFFKFLSISAYLVSFLLLSISPCALFEIFVPHA